jgi:FAD/FMN-containing dehydrogenase/Fe-S oxidoreductase
MFDQIKAKYTGELYSNNTDKDNAIKRIYATDASEYQELPLAVALPKTENDIKILVEYAVQSGTHLIPRAAGTSLAGQVVGSGIVVDISKHFTQIIELNPTEKWVRVQPGVIRDDLNVYLKPFGLMYGPETSTSNRAMIGGMIGNNSCGLHSIIWGTARDHLLECRVILADGSEAVFRALTEAQYFEKCNQKDFEGEIYRRINGLLTDPKNQKTIREGFPSKNIKRRNTGYALDFLLNQVSFDHDEQFNMCQLIAGSEGTLCYITEAKLQLMDLPPSAVAMVAIHTASIHDALLANLVALEHQCAASELVDHFILEFTKTNPHQSKNRSFIEGEPNAILMVEFFGTDEANLIGKCQQLISDLKDKKLGYAFPILQGEESKKAWEVRKGGLGLLRNLPGDAKPVNLIEDFAVDPKDLPDYIEKLEKLLKKRGLQYAMYAHAGAGELHVEPIINLKTKDGVVLFRTILTETATLAKSFGGSLSGEHGDGRLRGEFIPLMMGKDIYLLFKDVKSIFDPKNVFNKGKIVDAPPMDQSLRYQTESKVNEVATTYNFSDQGGFLRLAEKCSGSGDCRKTAVGGGTMCPSYMATRHEKDTTRARANILRQFLSNQETNVVTDHEVKEILDLCLSCKACKSECPSSVDVAKMKGEFLQNYYDRHGVPFRAKLIGNFSRQMALVSYFPGIFNFLFGTPSLRKVINRMVGFHPERSMPHLSKETLHHWYKKNKSERDLKPGKTVYVFCDEFTNYNDAEVGKKLILLLRKLGYNPVIPDHKESGRAYMSKGMIKEAKNIALINVEILKDIISADTPLIGIEPSAILSFRDEYPDLVPDRLRESAKNLGKNSLLFEEWFANEIDKGDISRELFTTVSKKVILHGHCHQKALVGTDATKKVLSFPQNYQVSTLNTGCCGMAGSFGYEKEHYDLSMQVGELVLFPSIRAVDENVIVAASGTSCRHQIKDGTGRLSQHAIEILYDALAISI